MRPVLILMAQWRSKQQGFHWLEMLVRQNITTMCREIAVLPMASLHDLSFEAVMREMGWNQESGDKSTFSRFFCGRTLSENKTYSVTIVTSVPLDMGTSTALRYRRKFGKIPFFPFTEAFFNHAVITARDWFM